MNYVKQLAHLLGLEIEEAFTLDNRNAIKYRFTEESVLEYQYKDTGRWTSCCMDRLKLILNGTNKISKLPFRPNIYEMCPHCGEDIILYGWDVSKYGYQMICPYCGASILLCDECQNGDDLCACDWSNEKETCHKKRLEIGERLKKELKKVIIPRSIHDPERANLDSDDVWDIIDKVLNK